MVIGILTELMIMFNLLTIVTIKRRSKQQALYAHDAQLCHMAATAAVNSVGFLPGKPLSDRHAV